MSRTSPKTYAKQFAKTLRKEGAESLDYNYLREIFRNLRKELDVQINAQPKKLPFVPTDEEIKRYYDAVWKARNMQHMVIIKTLLYTGVRISECVRITLDDIDFDRCQIRINQGKRRKDRIVPFPQSFKETLAMQADVIKKRGGTHLFESTWKGPYSDRGIRKILKHYTELAGIKQSVSPHKLRHYLFTWLKKKGIADVMIQPYSGHESRTSLEIYSKLSLGEAQKAYEKVIEQFPI